MVLQAATNKTTRTIQLKNALRMFFAEIEQAQDADKDEGEQPDADTCPPQAQGAVELKNRRQWCRKSKPQRVCQPRCRRRPMSSVPPMTTEAIASNSMPVANCPYPASRGNAEYNARQCGAKTAKVIDNQFGARDGKPHQQ